MTSINFSRDVRLFAARMGQDACDILTQVAALERLPSVAIPAGLGEAKAHLLEVAAHLTGETTFQGEALELHAASVCCRAFRLAAAFAREDLAAERSGRQQILTGDEWRGVHRAIVAGCQGQVPVLRRTGTFKPPMWAVDLLEMTARLAEVGWGHEEILLKARACSQPTAAERRAAAEHTHRMVNRKKAWIAERPEAYEEAEAWYNANRANLSHPRPAGGLDIDGVCWVRMSPQYRTPAESAEVAAAARQRELDRSNQTVLIGRGGRKPFRAHRDVLDCLNENRRKASEFARCARTGGSRRLQLA